jgi:predicted AlkP superfamily phosphohydrolase/phosphomutase
MKTRLLALILVVAALGVGFAYYKVHTTDIEVEQASIYIIGLDGASWNLINPMMERGKLPNLRKLKEHGTYAALESAYPAHSAFLWTTIATGKTKEKHGIGDFTVKGENAELPSTGNLRRVKAFWNILSERGIPVSVVNWWVTWPPEKVNGVMVSDRYRMGRYRQTHEEVTYPSSLQKELPLPEINKERAHREWKQYGLPELYDVTNDGRITGFDKALRGYPMYWCQDAAAWEASEYVLKHHPAKVFAVVFRIVDISSHFFWCYLPPKLLEDARQKEKEGKLTQADLDRIDAEFAKIIEPVYSYQDQLIGKMMESSPRGSTFVIVSDHGFGFHRGSYTHTTQRVPPKGILILSGGPYQKNHELKQASIYDVTPTLLYQLHLPVASDFDGKPLALAFNSDFRSDHQIAKIATWETGKRKFDEKPIPSPTDPETLEELKALGYIQK